MEEQKRGPGRPRKEPEGTVTCEILRDFWDAEGERHRAGTIVEVSVAEALDGIESGALRRAK